MRCTRRLDLDGDVRRDVPDDVAAAVQACSAALGSPVGLFNNAGVQGPFDRVDRYPLDAARRVIDVNVVGALNVLAIVGAAMAAAGAGGSIVCTASMAGVTGAPNMTAYSASKAAIIGMTKSAAKDLAPAGIRVNAVSPAFVGPGRMWDNQVAAQAAAASPYYSDDAAEVAQQMIGMIPLRRYGSTAEVARVVAFLLSDGTRLTSPASTSRSPVAPREPPMESGHPRPIHGSRHPLLKSTAAGLARIPCRAACSTY